VRLRYFRKLKAEEVVALREVVDYVSCDIFSNDEPVTEYELRVLTSVGILVSLLSKLENPLRLRIRRRL
jgi:hypothetical protein